MLRTYAFDDKKMLREAVVIFSICFDSSTSEITKPTFVDQQDVKFTFPFGITKKSISAIAHQIQHSQVLPRYPHSSAGAYART